jgi:tRNA threonylcarbamoyladenosine biosynthesis protein TsaB
MNILGLDTSSTDLSICLCADDAPVSTVSRYVRNSHAEHITQAVKLALDLGGISADQITHIAVSAGPGSFTGLRIGLSFVKGFCLMAERKVLPLSSLMVLAHAVAVNRRCHNKKIFAALDARQGRVHWGSFICDGNDGAQSGYPPKLRRLADDRLSSPDELMEELSSGDILITDTMGYQRSTVFDMFEGRAEIIRAEKSALSRGLSCAAIAFDQHSGGSCWLSAGEVVPNYLQMSAAEEKRAWN